MRLRHLALVLLWGCDKPPTPQPAAPPPAAPVVAWGEPHADLRLGLIAERADVGPADLIALDVHFEYSGPPKSLLVPRNVLEHGVIRFEVAGPDGRPLAYDGPPAQSGFGVVDEVEAAAFTRRVRIQDWFDFSKPGAYSIMAVYEVRPAHTGSAWTGLVRTGSIIVRVS